MLHTKERNEVFMENKPNYIQWLRSKVGHEKIILIFAGGCVINDKGEVLLQKRADSNKWVFPVVQSNWVKHHRWQR